MVLRHPSVRDIGADASTAVLAGASRAARTAAATALADHLHLDLYRIDLAAVASRYIGETEKNLSRLLDRTGDLGVILFFDEADALFGKRSTLDSSDDHTAGRRQALIDRLEDHDRLVVLGVTAVAVVDTSVFRRAPIIVEVDPRPELPAPRGVVAPPVRTVTLRTAIRAAAGAALASAATVAIRQARKRTP